jgi:HD superfamily phosphodiesterase
MANSDTTRLTERLARALADTFGNDERRIAHAHRVLEYARMIREREGGDERIVVAAALLHDVGIKVAEELHGSSAGPHQERYGPPLAREIMEHLGMASDEIDHVCDIIADHHSGKRMDTPEFRILWDADWLVNIPDEFDCADTEKIARIIERVFRTDAGRETARRLYLAGTAPSGDG